MTAGVGVGVDVYRFGDGTGMIYLEGSGRIEAWLEGRPIKLGTSGQLHVGSFAISPDDVQAEFEIAVDGVRRQVTARWPEEPTVDPPSVIPFRRTYSDA